MASMSADGEPPMPLALHRDDESVASGDSETKAKKKSVKRLFNRLFLTIAVVSFVVQIVSIVITQTIIVYVASIIGAIIAPIVVIRQKVLANIDSFRKVHNTIRVQVNRLQLENIKLHAQNGKLEEGVQKLKINEEQMQKIATKQGIQVDKLIDLVKENDRLLKAMKKHLKAQFEEDLLTNLLRSDRNDDDIISGREIDVLLIRLKNIDGVIINEELFRKTLANDGSILGIMNLIQALEEEENKKVAGKSQIFTLDTTILRSIYGKK